MIKLLEENVYLRIRKEDVNLVKGLISECQSEFEEILLRETKEEYKTTLHIIENEHLNSDVGGECGGVILYNENRKIVCINTLYSRLNLCFEELLP